MEWIPETVHIMVVVTWAAFLLATVAYVIKFPWRITLAGRWIVAMGSALVLSMSLTVTSVFWPPILLWHYTPVLALIAWSGICFTALVFFSTVFYLLIKHRQVA